MLSNPSHAGVGVLVYSLRPQALFLWTNAHQRFDRSHSMDTGSMQDNFPQQWLSCCFRYVSDSTRPYNMCTYCNPSQISPIRYSIALSSHWALDFRFLFFLFSLFPLPFCTFLRPFPFFFFRSPLFFPLSFLCQCQVTLGVGLSL